MPDGSGVTSTSDLPDWLDDLRQTGLTIWATANPPNGGYVDANTGRVVYPEDRLLKIGVFALVGLMIWRSFGRN